MTIDASLPDCDPSASGIVHCLHLLAEDAARLGLVRTHLAICQVLEICEAERIAGRPGVGPPCPFTVQ